MRTAWALLALMTCTWVVLLLVLSPPHPDRRVPVPAAVAVGLAAGVLASAAVLRRDHVAGRAAELAGRAFRLPKARLAILGLAAVNEELLWRRLVLGGILPSGALAALAVSTLGFALAHRARPALHLGTGATFGGLYLERTLERIDRRESEALGELVAAIREDEPLAPLLERLREPRDLEAIARERGLELVEV